MSDEIVINKEPASLTLDLNENEKALLDEIEVVKTIPVVSKKPSIPFRPRPPVVPMMEADPALEAFMNPTKRSMHTHEPPPPEEWDGGMPPMDEMPMGMGMEEPHGQSMGPQPSAGYSSIEDEKADLLNKLARLEKKGFKTSSKLSAYADIEQIRTEYKRIMYSIETDQSVKMARRVLVACVTGIEFLNKRYDPFDLELDGWSENMMENIDDYDTVFEELHAKYRGKMSVAPEIKLMFMIGGSAMMFHLSKSMLKGIAGGAVPAVDPQILKNMMEQVQANSQPKERPPTPKDSTGRREMRGPGLDLSSLMGGFMAPPPPVNSRPVVREQAEEDEISDIVSEATTAADVKDVTVKVPRKRGPAKKKKEIIL